MVCPNLSPEKTGPSTTILTFGIPETDAIEFSAHCESGQQEPKITIDLMLDYGDLASDQPIDVNMQGLEFKATYAGKIFQESSEYAGVRLALEIDDPFWQVFSNTGDLAVQIVNHAPERISLHQAARPVQDFLKACRAYFSTLDAAPPEPEDVFVYACEDGSQLRARFDNSRSTSIAYVSHGDRSDVALIQVVSGSGVRYSNGELTLHTKAGDALLIEGEKVLRCHSD